MSEQVMRQHIDLYVNNYSLDLGEDGKKAIRELYAVFNSQQQPGTGNFQELFMENN